MGPLAPKNIDYFDDFLNVCALLREKSNRLLEESKKTASEQKKADRELTDLEDRVEAMLEQANRLAAEHGLHMEEASPIARPQPAELPKIPLPSDFDFQRAFRRLAQEAKDAGYVNVHPEDLLTAEEMRHAQEFDRQLDEKFAAATGLQSWDLKLVWIGAAMHAFRALFLSREGDSGMDSAEGGLSPDMNMPGAVDVSGDMGSLGGEKSFDFQAAAGLVDQVFPVKHFVGFRSPEEILDSAPAFLQVSEDSSLGAPLGTDRWWGWLFGVLNIVTDTVTYRGFGTYTAMRTFDGGAERGETVSLRELLTPFTHGDMLSQWDTLLAGVIREAYVLIPNEMEYESMSEFMRENRESMGKLLQLGNDLPKLNKYLGQVGMIGMINTILIALHGLRKKRNEDTRIFRLRTMKVLSLANTLGSAAANMRFFIEGEPSSVDVAGLLAALIESVHTMRFWINLKVEFLTKHYLEQLQGPMEEINSYFEML